VCTTQQFGVRVRQDLGWTLEEVELIFGVTREHIRQIEAKALPNQRRAWGER
jgi:DNA-directed RNA polymerase sigma subunit (sigma70/sigma32)